MKNIKKLISTLENLLETQKLNNVGFIYIEKVSQCKLNVEGKIAFPEGIKKVQKVCTNIPKNYEKYLERKGIEVVGKRRWGVKVYKWLVTHNENFYLQVINSKNRYYYYDQNGNKLKYSDIKDYLHKSSKVEHGLRTYKLDENTRKVSFKGYTFQ
jgi:hypothetical protein